ncbi:MAG TPA: toll/interleukin-1 receptor domain-containing protein [Conexibacter sp.]|nr:toll/interleukin-1 receptor domain-containing protein [Conexibacter sp.]
MTAASTPSVFISYRREGTAMHAGRLYDAMAARFGEHNVFMDLEMAPGVDFVERITTAVGSCRALLVVIGPEWMGAGGSRIADPADFVRLEVETALRAADVTVIPVLVEGARMPAPEELPEELRPLARRNAIELSDLRWRYDCQRLTAALDELLAARTVDRAKRRAPRTSASAWALVPLWLEGVLLAVAAGVLARWLVGMVGLLNPEDDTILTTVARRTLVWAAVAGVLVLWLSLRRGDQGRLLRRVAIALVYGALAGALGGLVYALAIEVERLRLQDDQAAVAVVSLAITGGLLGLALGALWIPPRAVAGLVAGACGGALAQLLLNAFNDPKTATVADSDVFQVACQCLAIFGFALLLLLVLDARRATAPQQLVAAPEAARA